MDEHVSLKTQTAVAKAAKVDQKTVGNILNPKQRLPGKTGKVPSPTLYQVEQIAGAFGKEVWELLHPELVEVEG